MPRTPGRGYSLTLDEAIDHALDVVRNRPVDSRRFDDVACVVQHGQLARWLQELRERRKLGYHPPCPSCRWKDRCSVAARGEIAKDWHCTMYEHSEEPFPAVPNRESPAPELGPPVREAYPRLCKEDETP